MLKVYNEPFPGINPAYEDLKTAEDKVELLENQLSEERKLHSQSHVILSCWIMVRTLNVLSYGTTT